MKLPDDPFILELLPEFLDTWIEELNGQYLILVQTKNEQDLYCMGHTIKGSCAQFGLEDVSKMGIELMGFARAHEWDKALDIREKILKAILEMKQFILSV